MNSDVKCLSPQGDIGGGPAEIVGRLRVEPVSLRDLLFNSEGDLEDHYMIQEVLGKGSFGEVRMGKHLATKSRRAVKLIKKDKFEPENDDKAIMEIKVLKDVSHPNILHFVEHFESETEFSIVTEIYEGGDLFDELIRRVSFTEDDTITVLHQLLSCLSYLKTKGIVHRDIKPRNIMLHRPNDISTIKLVDFGSATFYNEKEDQLLEETIGTRFCLAPEVLGGNYNHKCDVWSSGVLAFILLSGRLPFLGETEKKNFGTHFHTQLKTQPSLELKTFLRLLLEPDYTLRIDAQEALEQELMKIRTTRNESEIKICPRIFRNIGKTIEHDDFEDLIMKYIVIHLVSTNERNTMGKIFKTFDKNHDGLINLNEVLSHPSMPRKIRKHLLFNNLEGIEAESMEFNDFLLKALGDRKLLTKINIRNAFRKLDQQDRRCIILNRDNMTVEQEPHKSEHTELLTYTGFMKLMTPRGYCSCVSR